MLRKIIWDKQNPSDPYIAQCIEERNFVLTYHSPLCSKISEVGVKKKKILAMIENLIEEKSKIKQNG